MNNQPRTELLAAIMELCDRYPDWRFGQLVSNVAGWTDQEIWDVEDKQLLQAARLHLKQSVTSHDPVKVGASAAGRGAKPK
jgi:hypothetical protein